MELFDDIIRDVMIQVTNLQSRTRNNGAISIEGKLQCCQIFFNKFYFVSQNLGLLAFVGIKTSIFNALKDGFEAILGGAQGTKNVKF